jgi:hypothetical protein
MTAVVQEPQDYWGGCRTDLIRQVFDGGFGRDVDDDPQFKLLYNTYVEAFSSNCTAYLPAGHESVVVTKVTTRTDRYGNTQQSSEMVEVDSRLAPMYRAYGENLLRGATSQRSLQQLSGSAAAGAQGFTHFGDACNAYYRNPADARYAPSDATAYCKCLAEKYRYVMTRAKEAYFAADFRARFLYNIAQPKNSGSHPAWSKLHPAAVACAR